MVTTYVCTAATQSKQILRVNPTFFLNGDVSRKTPKLVPLKRRAIHLHEGLK
jgi:hypothetical protein